MTKLKHLLEQPEVPVLEKLELLLIEQMNQQCLVSKALNNHVLTNLTNLSYFHDAFPDVYKKVLRDNKVEKGTEWIEFDSGQTYLVPKIGKKKILVNEHEYVNYLIRAKQNTENNKSNKHIEIEKPIELKFTIIPINDPATLIDAIEQFVYAVKHERVDNDVNNRGVYHYQLGMVTWHIDTKKKYYDQHFDTNAMDFPKGRIDKLIHP